MKINCVLVNLLDSFARYKLKLSFFFNIKVSLLICLQLYFFFFGLEGLWIHAMGCSLLVSMCSLICLTLLPVILCKWFHLYLFLLHMFLILGEHVCNINTSLCWHSFPARWQLIFCVLAVQGKPSKTLVDSLAAFGVRVLASAC